MSTQLKFEALVTNLTANDDAFAVVPDTGDSIYIPPGVTRASKLVAGEYRTVSVIANNPDRQSNTKWMGIFVDPPQTSMPEVHRSPDASGKLLDALEDGYLTTAEAAQELGVEVVEARDILNKLFNERKVARADVHYGSNKRAHTVLWSRNPEGFL